MLTSRDNPMVKLCRRLQTGAKARREEGLFLAEGVRLCREALSAGEVRSILATQAALDQNPWLGQAGEVVVLSPGVAQAISDTKTPQGVFCLCALPKEREPVFLPEGRYLLLDRLQDPGNLGTILRGAEAFGVTAVILGPGCPDPFSPKVLRSTMGSVFRQPFFSVEDLPGTIQRMEEEGKKLPKLLKQYRETGLYEQYLQEGDRYSHYFDRENLVPEEWEELVRRCAGV